MFYRHFEIDNQLYLYIANYEEFSKEFLKVPKMKKEQTIEDLAKDYFSKHKVPYENKKIHLVLDGIVIATIFLHEKKEKNHYFNKRQYQEYLSEVDLANTKLANTKVQLPKEESLEIIKHEPKRLDPKRYPKKRLVDNLTRRYEKKMMIPLLLPNGKMAKIELESYIIGILSSVMPVGFHIEALKAQAVILRTILLKKIYEKKAISPYAEGLIYRTPRNLQHFWKGQYSKNLEKIKTAVFSTKGEYLSYDNYFIHAFYHYSNNGKTEDAINVLDISYPYLRVVNSPWDKQSSEDNRVVINHLLGLELTPNTKIKVLERTLGDSIHTIQIGEKIFDAKYLKDLLNLRSTDTDFEVKKNYVELKTRGFGSQLGMSQYGADAMAKEQYDYRQILNHYYPNTFLIKLIL